MKLIIEEDMKQEEIEITIKCASINPALEKLISQIRSYAYTIKAEKDNKIYQVVIEQIEYIESIEEQTYLYVAQDVYRCDKKLYELEELLKTMSFVRINKSCIVNVYQLVHVNPLFDGKFEAVTQNNNVLIVSRHYLKAFKEVFGL